MVSQKKGFKRFYTQEIKEIKDQYNEAKAQTEEALKQAANRLFARFSTHFPLWKRAVSAAAELDCLIALAKVSAGPGMCRPRLVDQPGPFLKISGGVNPCVAHSLAGRDAIGLGRRLFHSSCCDCAAASPRSWRAPTRAARRTCLAMAAGSRSVEVAPQRLRKPMCSLCMANCAHFCVRSPGSGMHACCYSG